MYTGQGTRPYVRVYVSFDTSIANYPVWTDITPKVRSVDFTRGRILELNNFDVGTCTITLDSNDGSFDPSNTSGAYYPHVTPRRRIRIQAEWDGSVYTLWTGYAENWVPTPAEAGKDLVTVLQGVDALKLLNLEKLTATWPTEPVTYRLLRAWRASQQGFSYVNTSRNLPTFARSENYTGTTTALQSMQQATDNAGGFLYCDEQGNVRFDNSDYRTTYSTSSLVTFGNAGGEMPFMSPQYAATDSRLYTQVSLTDHGGNVYTAPSSLSTQEIEYGTSTLTKSITNQADPGPYGDWTQYTDDTVGGQALANTLVARYQDPKVWIGTLKCRPDVSNTLWPNILGLTIGGLVTVNDRPAYLGGSAISYSCYIEQISHTITPGNGGWECQYVLSPAQTSTPLTGITNPVPLFSRQESGTGQVTFVASPIMYPTPGAFLIVVAQAGSSSATAPNFTISDALGGLAWTRLQQQNSSSPPRATVAIFYAVAGANRTEGSVTVTETTGLGLGIMLTGWEMTNQNASPIGATLSTASVSGSLSSAPASTSVVFTAVADLVYAASQFGVPSGYTPLVGDSQSVVLSGAAVAYQNGGAATSITWTNSDSLTPVMVALEIKH